MSGASPPPITPGQGPTPEQIAQMQAAMAAEAQKRGLTPAQFQAQQKAQLEKEAKAKGLTIEQYVSQLRAEAIANHQRQMQAQAQQGQVQQQQPPPPQGQAVPINNSGTPDPKALALAKWLRTQDLKTRTCILNGQRKDMFKVKRALRAIESPAYATASSKPKSGLPQPTPTFPPAEVLKLLPLSLLALRVSKSDPHEGHGHAPPAKPKKRVKGLWTVRIEQQQDISPELHYVFLYDGPQWKTKLYATGALVAVFALILFPLWPLKMRLGVWYLSMGCLGLLGLFFAMAIVRLILFVATVFIVPPGLWLYPNLFEDVGFFDSFRPVWGWQEDKKAIKKAKRESRKAKAEAKADKAANEGPSADESAPQMVGATNISSAGATSTGASTTGAILRDLKPRVEEVDDDDSD